MHEANLLYNLITKRDSQENDFSQSNENTPGYTCQYTVNKNPKENYNSFIWNKKHFLYKYKGEINLVYRSRISGLCMLTLLIGSARIHPSQSTYNPGWESVYIWCWPKWPKWFQSWYFISLVISKKCYLKIVLLYNIRQISSVLNALEDSILIPKPAQAGKADCSVHGAKLYCRAVF